LDLTFLATHCATFWIHALERSSRPFSWRNLVAKSLDKLNCYLRHDNRLNGFVEPNFSS